MTPSLPHVAPAVSSVVYSIEFLTAIASISITIAGFSGVVVALTGRSTEKFTPVESLNLRILLQVSALALFFSLLPLILHRAFDTNVAWRISMLFYGGIHLLDAIFFALKTKKSGANSKVQIFAPTTGIMIAISQLVIGIFAPINIIEVAYMVVLLWHLTIAGMGFVKLVFASRD